MEYHWNIPAVYLSLYMDMSYLRYKLLPMTSCKHARRKSNTRSTFSEGAWTTQALEGIENARLGYEPRALHVFRTITSRILRPDKKLKLRKAVRRRGEKPRKQRFFLPWRILQGMPHLNGIEKKNTSATMWMVVEYPSVDGMTRSKTCSTRLTIQAIGERFSMKKKTVK